MEVEGYQVPEGLLYTKEHEWVKKEGPRVRVGITDYAAKTLNDVVYVTPPKVDGKVIQFQSMGTVESIKAVSELYSPVTGVVVNVNPSLDLHPELINKSPYDQGWILEAMPTDFEKERGSLMDPTAYSSFLRALIGQHGKHP